MEQPIKVMNKEKMNQIIDEVYENYVKSFFKGELKKNYEGGGYDIDDYYYSIIDVQNLLGWPQDGPVSKKEFINKCKTDPEFSETWGLKIEERELSISERINLFMQGKKVQRFLEKITNKDLDGSNIPTKLITITYNNETIESYE
jgi:hypothetical protein